MSSRSRPRRRTRDADRPYDPETNSPKPLRRILTHPGGGIENPNHTRNDDKHEKDTREGSFAATFRSRGTVLVTLMVVQSLSGMILGSFEGLIQDHVVVTLFLTMLVGAGGNAGNQSTVNVIRGLATGEINPRTRWSILLRECKLGLGLGLLLCGVAFLRVVLWGYDMASAVAIGTASLVIVSISAVVGAALPLAFVECGIDAAHAGPAIQVAMDIIGVTCTCIICSFVFTLFAPGMDAVDGPGEETMLTEGVI